MEWNDLLLWIAGPSCVFTLITAVRQSPKLRGWIFVCGTILVIGISGFFKFPESVGCVAGGLWAMFVLAPLLLQLRANRLAIGYQYQRAARLVRIAGWLHPFDGIPEQKQFLLALQQYEAGDIESAIIVLQRLEQSAPARTARVAAINARRFSGDWTGLLSWVDENIPPARLFKDPSLLPMYVRALGETGQLSKMLVTTWASKLSLHPQLALQRNLCRMYAFVFCGQTELLRNMFAGVLQPVTRDVQRFWLATADYAAGDIFAAEQQLRELDTVCSAGQRLVNQRRRENPPSLADLTLTPEDQMLLQQLELQQNHERRFATAKPHPRRPWVTYGLILANVFVFVIEWAQGAGARNWVNGGTMSIEVLHRLGAMEPDVLTTHEYYRLFMANFLHFGYPHILMNMLALLILGPFVEFSIGRLTYLMFYLVSGICVMVTVLWLQLHRFMAPELLVGASGAIMAVIGGTAAILLRGWYRERARAASRRLIGVASILLVQVTFDHFTPQVSGAAHIAGMVWGFVLVSLIPHRRGEETSETGSARVLTSR